MVGKRWKRAVVAVVLSLALPACEGSFQGAGSGGDGGSGEDGGSGDGGACGTDTWSNFAGPFFGTYCNRCHGWDQASVKQDPQVIEIIQGGGMPLGDLQPSQDEINRLQAWIDCGQP